MCLPYRAAAPLFVGLFWQNALQTHITVSIRKLLEVVTLLLMDFSGSEIEVCLATHTISCDTMVHDIISPHLVT